MPVLFCICGNTSLHKFMGIQYAWDEPEHYDGVSEYRCLECGRRYGRWTGKLLEENEREPRFGKGSLII